MITQTNQQSVQRASFSAFSIAAVICAVLSFVSGGWLGLLFAVLAIVAGGLGVMMALAPSVRGGLMSMFAALAGCLGIIVAIVRLVTRA